WYYGDGSPVPVVRGAEIVAWVGDQPLTLAELEDSTVGSRRPPGGGAVVVRGRAAGVWGEAERLTAAGARPAQATRPFTLLEQPPPRTAAPPRTRRRPHAPVPAPRGRRPGGAACAVRAILARRPGAPRTGRGACGLVHAGRVVGHRRRSRRDHQSGLQRRAVRPTILPAHRARRRLPASHRRARSERSRPARPRLAHRPDSRA